MEELALKIENIEKEYRLGTIGGATLKGEIQSKMARLRHREDPNLKIGQQAGGKNERFKALDGVDFEVKKGETLGILGHNGAGKSTLLKLICRVTAPTKGNIYIDGRITSMLEVGTGFHPELTGRENVYLNGAILGMSKAEIDAKFDEIVEFSEVGKFIDTPIKRYSSGMKVKLAFSVASHLDSEIMIMDEVLAVGDVNFQNKCIDRMREVAEKEGRTILYVSHNMPSVKKLCDRCIVLSGGKMIFDGDTDEAIAVYLKQNFEKKAYFDVADEAREPNCSMKHLLQNTEILTHNTNVFDYGEKFTVRFTWKSEENAGPLYFKTVIGTSDADLLGVAFGGALSWHDGINSADFVFDTQYFVPGHYFIDVKLYDEDSSGAVVYYDQITAMNFTVEHCDRSVHLRHWFSDWGKNVIPCLTPCDPQ